MVESSTDMSGSTGYVGTYAGGDLGGTSTPPLDQAKQNVRNTLDQAKEKVGPAVAQVKEQAATQIQSTLSTQKDACAESLTGIAQAFRSTADNLRQSDQAPIGQYAETVAGWVDSATGYLNERDVNEIVRDVEGLARRQPALFIGTAFALGFLAARFLKSSSSQAYSYNTQADAYSGTIYGSGAYGSAIEESTLALPSSTLAGGDSLSMSSGAETGLGSSVTGYGAMGVGDVDAGIGSGISTGAIGPASGTPLSSSSDLEIHTSPDYDDEMADDTIDSPQGTGRI